MTILESTSLLLKWFQNNHSFSFKHNYDKFLSFISHVTETPEADQASFQLGLEELVTAGVIKKTTVNKNDTYILIRPFNSMVQNISLTGGTCIAIGDIIKKTAEQLGRKDISVDALNLTEQDIITAIGILMEAAQIKLDNKEEN